MYVRIYIDMYRHVYIPFYIFIYIYVRVYTYMCLYCVTSVGFWFILRCFGFMGYVCGCVCA